MWKQGALIRFILCLLVMGFCLYSYVDTQNEITRLRLDIPRVAKEVRDLKEHGTQLQYQIDLFESPEHLIQLSRQAEFSHLKNSTSSKILRLEGGIALQKAPEEVLPSLSSRPQMPIATKSFNE